MADVPQLVVAQCPACGERRFRAASSAPPAPDDILTCEACGLKLTYAFLQSRMAPAPERVPRKATRGKAKRKKTKSRGGLA